MNRHEAENFMEMVVPSVFEEIKQKRTKAVQPLYRETFDPAAKTNQLGDCGFNQTEAIQQAITVVVQYCMKVSLKNKLLSQ